MAKEKRLSEKERENILRILRMRFEHNRFGHTGLVWGNIQKKLDANDGKLWSLHEMERTGGEPDLVRLDRSTGEMWFFDCSQESPKGRRSTCYDKQARESRKKYPPQNSALEMATAMGVTLLTETQYIELQKLGKFDLKTSSWLRTPPEIRALGGAIFGDFRYGQVFVYHNGASSYYATRGFRASLKI